MPAPFEWNSESGEANLDKCSRIKLDLKAITRVFWVILLFSVRLKEGLSPI